VSMQLGQDQTTDIKIDAENERPITILKRKYTNRQRIRAAKQKTDI
jgi:hypothetical protein